MTVETVVDSTPLFYIDSSNQSLAVKATTKLLSIALHNITTVYIDLKAFSQIHLYQAPKSPLPFDNRHPLLPTHLDPMQPSTNFNSTSQVYPSYFALDLLICLDWVKSRNFDI